MTNDLALLALRMCGLYLALGHGWGKVVALASGEGGRFVEGVAALGFPLPGLFAWAAALGEFGGGLLVFLGLGTRVAAGFAAFTMCVAAFARHKAHLQLFVLLGLMQADEDSLKRWGNPELALVYLTAFVAVALAGPGRLALDRFVRRR